MNSHKQSLAFIGIIIIMLISCDRESIELDNSNALIPIKTGNMWAYKMVIKNNSMESIDTVRMKIGSSLSVNDYEGYIFDYGQRPFNAKFFAKNDLEGNLVLIGGISDNDTLLVSSIQFKNYAEKGESWDFDDVILHEGGTFEKRTIQVHCLNTDTTIVTKKGDYTCKVFEQTPNAGDNVYRYYISNNVGIVKIEHFESNKLFSYNELIDLELFK
ncbi:hypothetical protein [Carboxylicivirga sp. M1479]|uniref:hypothetical protein n=1 Tax=Carboxylicivirga sp. M1479 TaxID=2594476 RepID=UPI0011774477|nr:hypothetical protein [Carboxylicivirga sp. M1479]TRX65811.1 hypothetical protein FNN09_17060 [Carboxylicivirga sp. M1479]